MKNKTISGRFSIAILIIIASFVLIYSLDNIKKFETELSGSDLKASPTDGQPNKTSCRTRAFEGEAKIKVWRVIRDGKSVLEVSDEDAAKLPMNYIKNFQLIDPTPTLEKKLAASSESRPIEIEIAGFAIPCGKTALASLNYKDGIFRPYIVN